MGKKIPNLEDWIYLNDTSLKKSSL
jgi:hypothetical protein